jgi:formate hydrogenlyase transcriptional activator
VYSVWYSLESCSTQRECRTTRCLFPSPRPEPGMLASEHNPRWFEANDVLSESGRRVRLILDSAAEAICGCDSAGTCLFANRSAARILGYADAADLLGRNLHSLEHHTRKDGTPYPIEDCPIYLEFQKGESVHRDDEVYWRKDDTSFPVEYWSYPVIQERRTVQPFHRHTPASRFTDRV